MKSQAKGLLRIAASRKTAAPRPGRPHKTMVYPTERGIPRVYRELRRVAAHLLQNERPRYILQSADLVHEAYLRLVNARETD